MKKVLLINSPIYDRKVADNEDYLPAFGLAYIATGLKDNNIDVKIIDAVYNNYTVVDLLNIIDKEMPGFVGVNIFSINFKLVKDLIEKCKANTKFIVGSKSTRFLYKDIVNFKSKNEIIVTIGEGELITPDIVNDCVMQESIINSDNRKVYLVNNDSIYLPSNLDEIKLDRNFIKDRAIVNPYGQLEEAIVTSRECLYNCAFCGGARSLNGDVSVRCRSVQNIEKELLDISINNPETECIRILDDLFLKNRKSIQDAILLFNKFNFHYRAMCHILSIKDSYDLLDELKNSGCLELEIGIESGSEKIRKLIHKAGSIQDIKIGIKKILDSGINVKGYFMYGFLNENLEDALKTYSVAKELHDYSLNTKGKFKVSSFQFRPYHGTELYNKIGKSINYFHNDNLNELDGRQQFNFTAGNFSNYNEKTIEKLVILTNNLNEGIIYEKNDNMSKM